MRTVIGVAFFFWGWMSIGCAPSAPSSDEVPSAEQSAPPQSPLQKAVHSHFTPDEGAMFASVTASASCEAALKLCLPSSDCEVSTVACQPVDYEVFSAQSIVVVRNQSFLWLRVDVKPTRAASVEEVFAALHAHFNERLHTAEAVDGFAHWEVGEEIGRYDVALITHTDAEQKPYISVSYYPGGI